MTTQGRELTKVRVVDVAPSDTMPIQDGLRGGGWVQRIEAPANKAPELKARLAQMQQRGEIAYAFNYQEDRRAGTVCVYVERSREPRSRTPWYVAGFTAAFGALVGVGALIYASRYVLLSVAGLALLVLAGIKVLAHDAACECIIHMH